MVLSYQYKGLEMRHECDYCHLNYPTEGEAETCEGRHYTPTVTPDQTEGDHDDE